jgi:beta-glucanase (GH16 family)
MKETLKNLGRFLLLLVLVTGCQDDDKSFGSLDAPTALELNYDIVGKTAENLNGDGSGNVILKAHANGAISYKYTFPDGSTATVAGGQYTKQFTTPGINSYEVVVIAYGKGGVSTSGTFMVEDVLSNFNDPVTTSLLTGNGSKIWYWAAAEQGHLGVGPNTPDGNNYYGSYYGAAPFEKAGSEVSSCLYDNKLTFTLDGNLIKYTLDNGGATFFNKDYTNVVQAGLGEDTCLPFDTSGQRSVVLAPAQSFVAPEHTTGTQMTFSDNGFMGYYIGTSTYEILELTENRMVVRAIMGNNPDLAWYHIFTTQDPNGPPAVDYTNLVWQDEFETGTAPDPAKWNMEIGNGQDGWGNQELQYYRAENATISGGNLVITAKKETFNGFQYTSARMTTHNHLDYTYGKLEIKAKLAQGDGAWSALWMLGSNYQTNQWPACGEIDMMEHIAGDTENIIHATLHYPGNSGGNGSTASTDDYTDVTTNFHIYSLIWSPETITWLIDNVAYRSVPNPGTPFNADFFVILNVAMGGNFGGPVDPNFVQSSMQIDYVRVYQ